MRIVLTSDWHLRNTTPENRVDNFFETQLGKIKQIFEIFNKEECSYILQAGDFFDSPRPSFEVLQYIIELFNKYGINKSNLFAIAGQHDLHYRNFDKTALKFMESLNYITICKTHKLTEDIHLFGASWGNEIPKIENMDALNILLIHKTIVDKPLWPGHDDFLQSDRLFKNNPYDIIHCGDNHHPVFYKNKNQIIIGCGSIVRKTISESDLIPHVYILDIEDTDLTYALNKIYLDYKPADEVFKPEALSREVTKENAKLQEFINNIKNNEIGNSLNFRKNLEILMKPLEKPIKDIILNELESLTNETT